MVFGGAALADNPLPVLDPEIPQAENDEDPGGAVTHTDVPDLPPPTMLSRDRLDHSDGSWSIVGVSRQGPSARPAYLGLFETDATEDLLATAAHSLTEAGGFASPAIVSGEFGTDAPWLPPQPVNGGGSDTIGPFSFQPGSVIPSPGAVVLLTLGGVGVLARRRR